VRTAKVFTRVRPPLERERRSYLPYADAVAVHPCGRTIALSENGAAAALSGAAAVEDGLASPHALCWNIACRRAQSAG